MNGRANTNAPVLVTTNDTGWIRHPIRVGFTSNWVGSPPDEVMQVVGDCFRALEPDCPRIGMNLKMDYRAGTGSRLQSKIDAVEQKLGRKLRT